MSKYYKLQVTMTTGFVYSFVCIHRMLEGMKKSSSGHWTEKVEVTEIDQKEYEEWYSEALQPEKTTKSSTSTRKNDKPKKETTKQPEKTTNIKFSSLENFFGDNDGTERHSIPPAKKGRNKTADTQPKVRARRKA